MRKSTVWLVLDPYELEWQMVREQVNDLAGPAIAGIDDNLERLQRCSIDVAKQMLDEVGLVGRLNPAATRD